MIEGSITQILNDNKNRIRTSLNLLENVIAKQSAFVRNVITKIVNQFYLLNKDIKTMKKNSNDFKTRLMRGSDVWSNKQNEKLEYISRLLLSFDIKKVLKRGFSLTLDSRGKLLTSIKSVNKGSKITTNLFDGKIGSQVIDILK